MFSNDDYTRFAAALSGMRLPAAFIDLDALDANIALARRLTEGSGKTIRLGTKSIRCEPILKYIFNSGGPCFAGLLTFTVEETAWLAGKGYNDMLVAYPTIQASDLRLLSELAQAGKKVWLMVDSPEHLQALSHAGQAAGMPLHACMEVDMAYRPLGSDAVHLGLRRSPVRTVEQALTLAHSAQSLPHVRITAIMGYEGHIAGTNDAVPGRALNNRFLRLVKRQSIHEFSPRRAQVVQALRQAGLKLEVINGGGSGSLVSSLADACLTEVTIGSGFYCSALFHHFAEVAYQPAAFFATQVVRLPKPGMVTCLGGGYTASGQIGPEKLPLPVLPVGLSYLPLEGAGEVQTPLRLPPGGPTLRLGDPVIFQHAKAGELCERFNELHLLRGDQIIDTIPTYRGEGQAFL
jgi:D-serine deaminase-like pyridoxal phosphate-dependent protein